MNLFWIKSGPLFPADTGGRKRTLGMLREISRAGHHVTYLALKPRSLQISDEETADSYATVKNWVDWDESPRGSAKFFFELGINLAFSSRPYVLDKYRSRLWREKIATGAAAADVVVCDFLTPAPNFEGLKLSKPTVLFQHNIESQIWKRLASTAGGGLKGFYLQNQWRRMLRWEERFSKEFDGVITVSPEDSDFCRTHYCLQNVLGDVPTGVDVDAFRLPGQSASLCIGFLGSMDWMPNVEAVLRFMERILPLIRGTLPEVRIKIIGRNPPSSILRLATTIPLVEVTGTVADVQPHVHECSVMVVPLMAGGGTRIKIFECMAMGVPVVSTAIGAEGLPVRHDKEILIEDEDEGFAVAVIRLLTDRSKAHNLASNARALMEEKFSWSAAATRFVELCSAACRTYGVGEASATKSRNG